jgi:hypothetical protein
MKISKAALRECGRLALERRGYNVEVVSGPGILPGARLQASQGRTKRAVAVRTSLDRELGLARHLDGRWVTIPKMDMVIAVVPSAENKRLCEVFCFEARVLEGAFDDALKTILKRSPKLSLKAPIFIALDDLDGPRPGVMSGLKSKARWRISMPIASATRTKTKQGFLERVMREFAEMNGVDISKVTVELRINL